MARPKDPHTSDRNRRICEAFLADRTLTDVELGKIFGASASTITRVLSQNGLISRENRRFKTPLALQKPKSALIAAVASIFSEACDAHDRTSNVKLSLSTGFNPQMLASMRNGTYDFSLMQLEIIAAWMGMSVADLIASATERAARVKVG